MRRARRKFSSEIDAETVLARFCDDFEPSRTFRAALTIPQHCPPQVLLSASLDLRRRRRGARGVQGAADSLGGLLRAAQESGIASSRCNGFVKVNWCHGATEVDASSLTDPATTSGLLDAAVFSGARHVASPGRTVESQSLLGSQLTGSWFDWRPEVDHSIAGGGVSDHSAPDQTMTCGLHSLRPDRRVRRDAALTHSCLHDELAVRWPRQSHRSTVDHGAPRTQSRALRHSQLFSQTPCRCIPQQAA